MSEPPRGRDDPGRVPAGVLLGVCGALVVAIAGVVTWAALERGAAERAVAVIRMPLEETRAGDCILRYENRQYSPEQVDVVDCATPHAAEIVRVIDADTIFAEQPAAGTASEYIGRACRSVQDYGVNFREAIFDEYPAAVISGYYTSDASWALGSRTWFCVLTSGDGRPLVGNYYTAEPLGE